MKLLKSLIRRTPPPAPAGPPPSLLPPIADRILEWPTLFDPVIIDTTGNPVMAIPLKDETEVALTGVPRADEFSKRCRFWGLHIILLSLAENAGRRGLPTTDVERADLLGHLLGPTKDLDRWNMGLLFLSREYRPRQVPLLHRTALTGMQSRQPSRLIEAAEPRLHLALTSGQIRHRC